MLFKGTERLGTWNFQAEKPIMAEVERLAQVLDDMIVKNDQKRAAEVREKIRKLHEEQRRYIIKDEIWDIYLRSGAVGLNASTGQETTQYYLSLPSNRLELWAILESDRFRNPVFREFYAERDVVFEERRLRTDTQPRGKLNEVFYSVMFLSHPYRSPVVGWPSDLLRMKKEEVEDYYRTHYAPNNAVVVFVGDVKFDEVVALMEKYFGDFPHGKEIQDPKTVEMEQSGERRVAVEHNAEPEVLIGYHTPRLGHPDQYALDVLQEILSGGRTSRLYRNLVEKKRIAVSATASVDTGRFPGLFAFLITPRTPHGVGDAEKAVYEEIERAQNEPIAEWEVAKAKNNLEVNALRRIRSNQSLARLLGSSEAVAGEWRFILDRLERWRAITAEDLMRVTKQYLTRRNRTVAWIERSR
jgi:predicted Zn-dependent peptidase